MHGDRNIAGAIVILRVGKADFVGTGFRQGRFKGHGGFAVGDFVVVMVAMTDVFLGRAAGFP